MPTNSREFPAPIAVHSHQYYVEGDCYGLGVTPEGRPFALVVLGNVTETLYLDGVYRIEFKSVTPARGQ